MSKTPPKSKAFPAPPPGYILVSEGQLQSGDLTMNRENVAPAWETIHEGAVGMEIKSLAWSVFVARLFLPEPPLGWRLLDRTEMCDHGDQVWTVTSQWMTVPVDDLLPAGAIFFARRIIPDLVPPDGFELLLDGTLQEGDLVADTNEKTWYAAEQVDMVGSDIPYATRMPNMPYVLICGARRIKPIVRSLDESPASYGGW